MYVYNYTDAVKPCMNSLVISPYIMLQHVTFIC